MRSRITGFGVVLVAVICRSVAGQTCTGDYAQTYTLKSLDDASKILSACGGTEAQLAQANPQIADLGFLAADSKICIPTSCVAANIGATANCTGNSKNFTTVAMNTISRLSADCNANISALNPQLNNTNILPTGLQICIPTSCTPTTPQTPSTTTPSTPNSSGGSSSQSSSSPPSKGKSISGGAIAGIVIGVLVFAALVLGALLYALRRKRLQRTSTTGNDPLFGDGPGSSAFKNESELMGIGAVYGNEKQEVSSGKNLETASGGTKSGKNSMTASGASDSQYLENETGLASIHDLRGRHALNSMQLPPPAAATEAETELNSSLLHQFHVNEGASSNVAETHLKELWKIDPANLLVRTKLGQPWCLGEGGYGKVYRGVLDKADVAVKVVISHAPEQQIKFIKEIVILKCLFSPFIVQFLGACIQEDRMFMVMELLPGDLYTSLAKDLGKDLERVFSWYKQGGKIALDVIRGLVYLHGKQIAHLDLKTPNILLTDSLGAKIADVGLVKFVEDPKATGAHAGSFLWAAPEQLLGQSYGTSADIFAFGTVLWEICTGERLPRNRLLRPLDCPREAPQIVSDLISECRSIEAKDRPTAGQVYDTLAAAMAQSR